jgi:hypothetical protein
MNRKLQMAGGFSPCLELFLRELREIRNCEIFQPIKCGHTPSQAAKTIEGMKSWQ